ncbi:MAG: hypothetical protein H6718_17795 [Polyangiaceae bacterium]|nr:hypothetical protein [Myxococcales bacterium]MCB9587257.1 hypothetical protein [Polyangiaceae bacterium]
MEYRLGPVQTGRVVLLRTRTGQFVLGGVLLILGAPAAALGAFVALADPLLGAKIAGFGLAFFGASVLVFTRSVGPAAFVFDDGAAALLAYRTSDLAEAPVGRLPYSAIRRLAVNKQVSSNSEGRSVTYAFDIEKRDGVQWTLYTSQSKARVEALLEQVKSGCNLKAPSEASSVSAPSGAFEVEREAERSVIRFKKPYRLITQFAALMAVGGISLAVLGFQDQIPELVFYAFFAIITLVLAAVAVGAVDGVKKHAVLTITPENFRSDQEGGILKGWFEEPIADLHAVSFSYKPNEDQRVVMLLNRKQYDVLTGPKPSDAMSALNYTLTMVATRKIEVGEMTLAQKLELEQLIQDEVERVSGKRLL